MDPHSCSFFQGIFLGLVFLVVTSVANPSVDMSNEQNEETLVDQGLDPENWDTIFDLSRRQATESEDLTRESSNNQRKRAMSSQGNVWGYNIPVVFDSTYSDPFNRNLVRRVMRIISSRTCLNLIDETDRWQRKNRQWFTQNGYAWDSCIVIKSGVGCSTSGSIKNGSNVAVKPCSDSHIILHEVLHALGIYHVQESNTAPRYISVFRDNIQPGYGFTYNSSSPFVTTKYYDPISTSHYSSGTFGLTGDDTFVCIRPEFCQNDETESDENVNFEELNEKYNCSEVYCSQSKVDCSPGYLAYNNRECRCVCPREFNSSTNCKTLIEGDDKSLEWPIPLTLFAGGETFECPTSFNPTGWFSFCVKLPSVTNVNVAPFPQEGNVIHIPVCSKTEPSSNIDWNAIPFGGRYCFIKAKGIPCGGILIESTMEIQSSCNAHSNGSVGSIDINGSNITITLCCNDDDRVHYPMALPSSFPFRLFMIYSCPHVRGMRTYPQMVEISPTKVAFNGSVKPFNYFYNKQHHLFLCYYQPAVYGCNQNVKLTRTGRKVTITTPGYPGARPPNTRCIYCFDAPESTKLLVTFNHYDLADTDKIRVKRFHKWLEPYRMNNANPGYQFVSDSNYLCMEYWSGYQRVDNSGANFTVELLFDSDSCYNTTQNGMDYVGTTNISENYEACLPWHETLACSDSPINGKDVLTGYFENNYCRNPEGKLLQPWCYVYRNDTSCMKRYCDVCNTKVPVDALRPSFCAESMKRSPTFCEKSVHRFGCFKSCGMKQAPARSPDCGAPPRHRDALKLGKKQVSFKAGDRVSITCKRAKFLDGVKTELLCTSNGWSTPLSPCTVPSKVDDKYKSCPEVMGRIPNLCNDTRTSSYATNYCSKSCGKNPALPKCHEPKSALYTRTSNKTTIGTGEVMTFACKKGYFLTGGDTGRACGTNGVLLGAEPVCGNDPSVLDVGLNLVRLRRGTTHTNVVFVMDLPGYRIPINGKITIWYHYCKSGGLIYFLVFRQNESSYNLLGYNELTCEPGWTIGYEVDHKEQITVQKGDMVGVWTPKSGVLSASDCKSAVLKLMNMPSTKISNINKLKKHTNFKDKTCVIPAIGFRVEKK